MRKDRRRNSVRANKPSTSKSTNVPSSVEQRQHVGILKFSSWNIFLQVLLCNKLTPTNSSYTQKVFLSMNLFSQNINLTLTADYFTCTHATRKLLIYSERYGPPLKFFFHAKMTRLLELGDNDDFLRES